MNASRTCPGRYPAGIRQIARNKLPSVIGIVVLFLVVDRRKGTGKRRERAAPTRHRSPGEFALPSGCRVDPE